MNRIAPWFSSCVFLSLALVTATVLAQSGQPHSALAEYEGEEGWSVGYALGHDTPAEAAAKAIEACNEGGVGNCRVAQKFSGTGCVAIAEGGDTLGYVTGGSPGQLDEMKDLAVKECQKDGESCRIVNSDCVRGHEEIVQSTVVGKDDQESGQSNAAPARSGKFYGAIAQDGFSVSSYALGFETQDEANASAKEICEKETTRRGCGVSDELTNVPCAVIALVVQSEHTGSGLESAGYGYGHTLAEANKKLLGNWCKFRGVNIEVCSTVISDCTDGRQEIVRVYDAKNQ